MSLYEMGYHAYAARMCAARQQASTASKTTPLRTDVEAHESASISTCRLETLKDARLSTAPVLAVSTLSALLLLALGDHAVGGVIVAVVLLGAVLTRTK